LVDARDPGAGRAMLAADLAGVAQCLWLYNKADLLAERPPLPADALHVSARTGEGLEALHARLLALAGVAGEGGEGAFSARRRHLDALDKAAAAMSDASVELAAERLELAAEALGQAHAALGEIVGKLDADGLLGHIFGTFCIGK
jgi:tRNA modification GTPase